jgi:sugar O-acyltransferase (sialic acid O-acetyltransferase NeuD family)
MTTARKSRKLLLLGDSAFAEVAFECFSRDSEYEVVGFSVESQFMKRERLLGLQVLALEEVERHFPPGETYVYVAVAYTQLNRLRARLLTRAQEKGYRPASYVSSRALVWPNVAMGEHCFVFEGNNVQPFARIGSNVVMWSGNHVGHHSVIEDNCFIASHCVISGFCNIGRNSFIGVNATLANNVTIAADNWIGPGVTITQDTEPNQLFSAAAAVASKVGTRRFFRVPE